MAFTKVKTKTTVYGDDRIAHFILTCDANSGAIDSGLSVIHSVHVTAKSATTTSPKAKINLSATQIAGNGSLFMSSCASGDDYYVTVYGR